MTEEQINEQTANLTAAGEAEESPNLEAVALNEAKPEVADQFDENVAELVTPNEASSTGGYGLFIFDTASNLSTFIAVHPDFETAVDAAQNYQAEEGQLIVLLSAVYSRMG